MIAGGGTAGWSSAAALGRHLGPLLDVTLVESEQIGIIGVGESTVPTAPGFHNLLGIDEREFMRENQASFKLAISFENWARRGDRYIHSFGTVGKGVWLGDFQHFWLEAVAQGFGGDLGDYCLEFKAAEAHKFFKSKDQPLNFAYHLDAALYSRYLRRFAESHGVKRVEGRIAQVEQDPESGYLRALKLESGERLEGDLFIDCTGFRALLIGQALGTGFEDWLHWLPTNSALPIQTRAVGPAVPYTRAIAHEAGWMWKIPLQQRIGCGLVFASDFMSDDEAHRRMHEQIEGEILIEPPAIRFRAGRRHHVWEKNCVAIGLAGGFVEPLESTAIHLTQIGITRFLQTFPFTGFDDALIRRFNERSREEIEKVRDFVIMHYHLTERDDTPFWNHVRTMKVPDTLQQRIELFRENAQAYQANEELFRVDSWLQVMIGQRLQPRAYHHLARLTQPEQLRAALASLRTNIASAVAGMPSHQDFLDSYCPATTEPANASAQRSEGGD
ncbi:MAG: tryptophan halogenase family protein [Sphingomonas sp.]